MYDAAFNFMFSCTCAESDNCTCALGEYENALHAPNTEETHSPFRNSMQATQT